MRSSGPETPCKKSSSVCTPAKARMRLLKQLEFAFENSTIPFGSSRNGDVGFVGQALRLLKSEAATGAVALQFRGRDALLEGRARELLHALNAEKLARDIRVQWKPRLQTAAG